MTPAESIPLQGPGGRGVSGGVGQAGRPGGVDSRPAAVPCSDRTAPQRPDPHAAPDQSPSSRSSPFIYVAESGGLGRPAGRRGADTLLLPPPLPLLRGPGVRLGGSDGAAVMGALQTARSARTGQGGTLQRSHGCPVTPEGRQPATALERSVSGRPLLGIQRTVHGPRPNPAAHVVLRPTGQTAGPCAPSCERASCGPGQPQSRARSAVGIVHLTRSGGYGPAR